LLMATAAMVVAQLKLIYPQGYSIHVGPPPDSKLRSFARFIDGRPTAAQVCDYVKDDVAQQVLADTISVVNEGNGIKYWLSDRQE